MNDTAVDAAIDLAVEVRMILFRRVALTLICLGAIIFLTAYCVAVYYDTPVRFRTGHRPYLLTLLLVCFLYILVVVFHGILFSDLMFDPKAAGKSIFLFEDIHAQILIFDHWTTLPVQAIISVGLCIVDGIMMVRCYIMYRDRRWVCIFPGVLYLASVCLGLTLVAVLTKSSYRAIKIGWSLTAVLFNVLVTSLIGTRLILADRALKRSSPNTVRFGPGFSRPIKVLVESALPPTLLGLVLIIIVAVPTPKTPEAALRKWHYLDFLNLLYYEVALISPLMIIFRVMTGKSIVWSESSSTRPTTFAAAAGRSSGRDQEDMWTQSTEVFSTQSKSMDPDRAHPLGTIGSIPLGNSKA